MSELGSYVDRLFSKYSANRQTEELKTEILGNLEAKKADLIAAGMEYSQAVKKAEESITSIDFLIDGNKQVYINRLKMEFAQHSMILIITGWIITIPLLLFRVGLPANFLMFLATVVSGIYTLSLGGKMKQDAAILNEKAFVSVPRYAKIKRLFWLLWSAFAVISTVATTALYFGSNIWFSRRISIDGPYALAVLLIAYFVPLLTVVIPLIASVPLKLVPKYETSENDEN